MSLFRQFTIIFKGSQGFLDQIDRKQSEFSIERGCAIVTDCQGGEPRDSENDRAHVRCRYANELTPDDRELKEFADDDRRAPCTHRPACGNGRDGIGYRAGASTPDGGSSIGPCGFSTGSTHKRGLAGGWLLRAIPSISTTSAAQTHYVRRSRQPFSDQPAQPVSCPWLHRCRADFAAAWCSVASLEYGC